MNDNRESLAGVTGESMADELKHPRLSASGGSRPSGDFDAAAIQTLDPLAVRRQLHLAESTPKQSMGYLC